MENNFKYPKVFEFFKELNQIPRGSGNEKQASDWLVKFAKDRNLEVKQDEHLNVIIRKPATAGYENAEPVILQGHMDMVPEKATDSDHDFTKDPIAFIVDGEFLRADKTTLGADNGIAVAMGLTVLDADDLPHPAIELLVTTAEETGMFGAAGLNPEDLKARQLINIDSEEEGILLTSCAGGKTVTLSLPIEKEAMPEDGKAYRLFISGLKGGHSGMEIDQQRGSANKLMGRLLRNLDREIDLRLVKLSGGSKHNAIPREAEAIIALVGNEADKAKEIVANLKEAFLVELQGVDEELEITLEEAQDEVKEVLTEEVTKKAYQILNFIPAGVLKMSKQIEGLVQTSNNLGVVETKDNAITFLSAIRSSLRSEKVEVGETISELAEIMGADTEVSAEYPEWAFNPNSKLREVFVASYKELYGKEPEVSAIHAGLECGLLSEKFDGKIDQISFGPNMYDVHTPKEHLDIKSTERTYEYLLKVLENLK